MNFLFRLLLSVGPIALCLMGLAPAVGADPLTPLPAVLDPRFTIQLFASEPDIVTPIGATFDSQGRLLVIESHTHFTPGNYNGPKHDRLRLIEDTDGDGRADRFRTFLSGTRSTMSLRRGPDDWIYVATRNEIFRIRDGDGDDIAEIREPIVTLQTKGDYPHNGLAGLALDVHESGAGCLYFGLGENLGVAYTLLAADATSWAGGGEGGGVFRVSLDGKNLTRVATGFWNPFGICVDPVGRLFAVDNDPDGQPPCRLLHVVPTGDYGFQFRFGRSGKHPLQAWNGELPGTLPMAAGTGEAPSGIVPFSGSLWTCSWGDNSLERFALSAHGATCRAQGSVVVKGDQFFRPVDCAVAPDGSLFFTDWVDKSYEVHGRGRIWRLSKTPPPPESALPEPAQNASAWLPLSPAEIRAKSLMEARDQQLLEAALADPDPFIRQAAVAGLVAAPAAMPPLPSDCDPLARLSVLLADRWRGSPDIPLREALADPDKRVQLLAVRIIAEGRLKTFRSQLDYLLVDDATSVSLFVTVLAALDWLDNRPGMESSPEASERRLKSIWQDESKPAILRAMSLRLTALTTPAENIPLIAALAHSDDAALSREAIRLLALRPDNDTARALAAIADDARFPASRRADAVVGLSRSAQASADSSAPLPVAPRAVPPRKYSPRPAVADTAAWLVHLGDGGDPEAGWRVFFSAGGGRCSQCHMLGGRGAAIGPDLTGIGKAQGRGRVLASLLEPSREIGPSYQTSAVTLGVGRVKHGISLGLLDDGLRERFAGMDGLEIILALAEIESRQPLATSIMPQGLEQGLSDEDLRDLLALLGADE